MADKYDVVVIGAGPGGYVAAIRAAQLGLRVACVEKNAVGGTCLNVGCIPSKTLLHWTEYYDVLNRHGADHGFDGSSIKPNWKKLLASKEKVIGGLVQGIQGLFKKNKIAHIQGTATFVSHNMVSVDGPDGKQTVEGANFIIATGSEPTPLPFLPFDEKVVVSSTGALSLPKVPKTMAVIGAGVIGLELGSVYNRLGTEVTVIEMLDHVTPGMDIAICKTFQQILTKQGLKFHLGTKLNKGKVSKSGVSLAISKDGEDSVVNADVVLVAVGRRCYSESLGLDKVKVAVSDRGLIEINDNFQTSVPNIYAIGDVVDGPMLAHKASEEGVVVAELLAGKAAKLNYMAIPSVIYTSPEVASVGFTETEARDLGIDVMIGQFPYKANSRARCTGEDDGLAKVIGDKKTGRLVGLHVIGPHAGEVIHEGVVALEKQATVAEIAEACHAHPTYSEAVKEAALKALGHAIHM